MNGDFGILGVVIRKPQDSKNHKAQVLQTGLGISRIRPIVMISRTESKLVWLHVKYILSLDFDGSTLSIPTTLVFMSLPSELVSGKSIPAMVSLAGI